MKGMNAHIKQVIILVNKSYSFLLPSVFYFLFKSCEFPYPVVDMRYKITGLELVQLFKGNGLAAALPGRRAC